jgi:hypothetical protein
MGAIKELFLEYQEEMGEDFIDDELQFQQWLQLREEDFTERAKLEEQFWAEQPPYPFATDVELEEMNDSIKLKYSDWDITSVLGEVLGDGSDEFNEILIRLNNIYNIKNGYIE